MIEHDRNFSTENIDSAERARVASIRGIQVSDLRHIARWVADPETHKHLDFAPRPPKSWSDQSQVEKYIGKFESYYRNGDEDPKKITPVVTINSFNEPTGVLTIRWRGDPYVPKDRRITSIEALTVNPELQHHGVGGELLSAALDITFCHSTVYSGQPAREARLWVFTDEKAGDYTKPINFFRKYGFETLGGNWREYAEKRGIDNVGDRDAMWFKLTSEKWEIMKNENKKLAKHAPIDFLSLRI